jgi:hypothetical protein
VRASTQYYGANVVQDLQRYRKRESKTKRFSKRIRKIKRESMRMR